MRTEGDGKAFPSRVIFDANAAVPSPWQTPVTAGDYFLVNVYRHRCAKSLPHRACFRRGYTHESVVEGPGECEEIIGEC